MRTFWELFLSKKTWTIKHIATSNKDSWIWNCYANDRNKFQQFFFKKRKEFEEKKYYEKNNWSLTMGTNFCCLSIYSRKNRLSSIFLPPNIIWRFKKVHSRYKKKSKNGDILINFYLFNMTLGNMSTCIYWHKFGNPDSLVKIYLYYSIVALLIPHS